LPGVIGWAGESKLRMLVCLVFLFVDEGGKHRLLFLIAFAFNFSSPQVSREFGKFE
jgi:hypothetical protein